jgi:hypothetical protein
MRNQFFYTRKEMITTPQENGEMFSEEKQFVDSINLNKVIRSVQMNDDTLVVLLDDMHQRTTEVPNINLKTNKLVGTKKKVEVYQTEAYLYGEDINRFRKLTNIENDGK